MEKLSNLMHAISFLLPADATSQLEEAQSLLNTANMVFNGPHYSRALVMLDVTPADPFVHDTVAAFQEILRDLYGEDTAMAGQLLALDDIAGSFSKDMMRVSAITILFVFVIVLFSFSDSAFFRLLFPPPICLSYSSSISPRRFFMTDAISS